MEVEYRSSQGREGDVAGAEEVIGAKVEKVCIAPLFPGR